MCCEVFATLCEISFAISSTERSPCASRSTISARRPLPSACATDANASNKATFAAPLAIFSSYHLNSWRSSVTLSSDQSLLAPTEATMSMTINPNKALWEKGDFTRIAESMRDSGEALVMTLGITDGLEVLDLGCGDGTTALPA